jgi:hypothetical protein
MCPHQFAIIAWPLPGTIPNDIAQIGEEAKIRLY